MHVLQRMHVRKCMRMHSSRCVSDSSHDKKSTTVDNNESEQKVFAKIVVD